MQQHGHRIKYFALRHRLVDKAPPTPHPPAGRGARPAARHPRETPARGASDARSGAGGPPRDPPADSARARGALQACSSRRPVPRTACCTHANLHSTGPHGTGPHGSPAHVPVGGARRVAGVRRRGPNRASRVRVSAVAAPAWARSRGATAVGPRAQPARTRATCGGGWGGTRGGGVGDGGVIGSGRRRWRRCWASATRYPPPNSLTHAPCVSRPRP